MLVSRTCFGGVSEIGGNETLLEDGNSRFLCDFGTSCARRYRIVSPRTLIPVHVEEPEYFLNSLRGEGVEVVLPKLGEEIPLAS
jgi:mRNA degradation ribonuclease J1/J2